jgi:hypothetical protein
MNELSVVMAQMSSYYACPEFNLLKPPHSTIIEQDKWWDANWFFVCFGCQVDIIAQLARQNLSKNNTPTMMATSTPWSLWCTPPSACPKHFAL